MKAQHTPGPWTALVEGESQQGGETHAIAAGPHYMIIAEVAISAEASTHHGEEGKTTIIESEGRANARLIAAAPELLAACQLFAAAIAVNRTNLSKPMLAAIEAARVAIVKALRNPGERRVEP